MKDLNRQKGVYFLYSDENIGNKLVTPVTDVKQHIEKILDDVLDETGLKYKKVNETTGKEVPPADIVKGFKIGKDVVIVEEEDFQKAMPEKYDHLEIVQFILEKEIEPLW